MPPNFQYIYLSLIESISVARNFPNRRGTDLTLAIAGQIKDNGSNCKVKVEFYGVRELVLGDIGEFTFINIRIENIKSWGLEKISYKVFEEENELLEFSCSSFSIQSSDDSEVF